jgi:hypothetical protein
VVAVSTHDESEGRPVIDMAELLASQPVVYVNLPQTPERYELLLRLTAGLVKRSTARR